MDDRVSDDDAGKTLPDASVRAPGGGRKISALAFVGGVLATLLVGTGIAYPFVADSIATSTAASYLAARGLDCPDLSVDASFDLSRAEIAPMHCTRTTATDEVEGIELVDPAFVDLRLFEPTHARAGRVRIRLRADDPGTGVDMGALGTIASLLRIPSRIGSATRAAAEIARHDLPPTDVSTAEIVRGEAVRVSLTDVRLSGGTATTFTISRIDLPALDGPLGTSASVALNGVSGDATPATCTVRGELQIDASVPLMSEIHRRTNATITATGLDGPTPDWDVTFEGS